MTETNTDGKYRCSGCGHDVGATRYPGETCGNCGATIVPDDGERDGEQSLQRLLNRLKEARQRRSELERHYHPRVEYCLICDESNLVVRDKETREYSRMDCRHDHYEHILSDGHENAQISAWIHCIEYLQERYIATESER